MRSCVDCKHFRPGFGNGSGKYEYATCVKTLPGKMDRVSGKLRERKQELSYCDILRDIGWLMSLFGYGMKVCGKAGRFFEPKQVDAKPIELVDRLIAETKVR